MKQEPEIEIIDLEDESTLRRPCKKKMKQNYATGLPQGNMDGVVKRSLRSTTKERADGLDKAESSCKSDDLSFSVVMKTSHVSGSPPRLMIPTIFAKKYLKKWKGDIILISVDERAWSVRYNSQYMNGGKAVRLGFGWRTFVADNLLQVGDECNFGATDHDATKFKVVICRRNQDGTRSPIDDNVVEYDDEEEEEPTEEEVEESENEEIDIVTISSSPKNGAATSSFSSVDFSEVEAEEHQMQPPEELLPTQESSLIQRRLEHVEPKLTNPFAALDFSFMATPAPTPISLSCGAVAAAQSVIADVLSSSLDVCSSRASEVMDSFDVLIRESKNANEANMISEIKGRVAFAFSGFLETDGKSSTLTTQIQSHMAEINAYNEKHKTFDIDSLEDKTRVEELKEYDANILELEKQLTVLKGKSNQMRRACQTYRDSLPEVEKELRDDQDRLSGYYESIQQWHREGEEYRLKAERLRIEWARNSRLDLDFLFP